MEPLTQQIIDARMQPVTITTVPMHRSEVEVFLGSNQPRSRVLLEAARSTGRRNLAPAVVAVLVVAAAVFGFSLGWLGVGASLLISLATAVGLGLALVALLSLVGGDPVAHCPGAWHK